MVVDVLQQDAKLGKGDEVAVLQRERKKRVEAAEAYERRRPRRAGGGRALRGGADRGLPARSSSPTRSWRELVDAAIAETGATEQKQMGQVMAALMPKVGGRADGKRVSAAVRRSWS